MSLGPVPHSYDTFFQEPRIADDVFVADSADLIGGVEIGEGSSVWYQCVIRADINSIRIGRWSNIQDGTVV
ncbi:MAG: hypothetical protein AAF191_02555, partial [Verrucomicrobiota bacterium]